MNEFKVLASRTHDTGEMGDINQLIKERTNIHQFFHTSTDIECFMDYLSNGDQGNASIMSDLGDYQTPDKLAGRACEILFQEGVRPDFLVEPTCGQGNLVVPAIKTFKTLQTVECVELQPRYEWDFKVAMLRLIEQGFTLPRITYHRADIFHFDLKPLIKGAGNILILGNPPWVTNSQLEREGSSNLPRKKNVKRFNGLDAITGKSNFDIAEFIITDLIRKVTPVKATLAMICKDTVIKNIVRDAATLGLKISNMRAYAFNAKKEFGVSAAASLFVADVGSRQGTRCKVLNMDGSTGGTRTFGWHEGKFISDLALHEKGKFIDGKCPFEWRQGLKHDLGHVMVLVKETDNFLNGRGERLDIESELLFPLVKSSDLQNNRLVKTTRYHVIVPQRSTGEDTRQIKERFPRAWSYFQTHEAAFNARKSRIYTGRPPFSIFGIGAYSFKPYKVGISGFYKEPRFSFVPPVDGKPVMMDDTCYFLSFDDKKVAIITWFLLELEETKSFLKSLVFLDAKRPYTKEVLMRVDLGRLARLAGLHERLEEVNLALEGTRINHQDLVAYMNFNDSSIGTKTKNLLEYATSGEDPPGRR